MEKIMSDPDPLKPPNFISKSFSTLKFGMVAKNRPKYLENWPSQSDFQSKKNFFKNSWNFLMADNKKDNSAVFAFLAISFGRMDLIMWSSLLLHSQG